MGRKARMRKLLREEDLEELLEQSEAEPEVTKEAAPNGTKQPTAVDKTLELQKAAGNRAVTAALQRWGGPGLAAAAQQQPKWPKEPELLLDGKPIGMEAYSETQNRPTSVGSVGGTNRPQGEEFSGPGDIHVVIKWGDWVADLYQAALEGRHYATVEIVVPTKDGKGFRMILTDVTLSGYTTSAARDMPSVQLSFSFKKRQFAQTPPPKR